MPLIDGVGDEVVQFLAVILIIVVAALAWWSTNARPDRYRTVLVMRSRAHRPVTVSIRRTSSTISRTNNSIQPSTSNAIDASTSSPREEVSQDSATVIPLQEMDSIVDADMAMMDNNRLHFFRRIDSPNTTQGAMDSTSDESETQEEIEPASNAQIREMDSIVSAMEADVTAGCDFFTRASGPHRDLPSVKASNDSSSKPSTASDPNKRHEENTNTEASDESASSAASDGAVSERRTILIKLKYLNDTHKDVEGSLDELLKDFKLRHFSSELSSQCRVRLIFNGRVLVDEAATLRACGLHHRAVVHCLVHPKRNGAQVAGGGAGEEAAGGATHELVAEAPPPERVWDLENILMTLVSVALTVVWFFRCEYSSMFTASASVALFGLTVFYSVAIFGLYISDTFHFDRRPAQHAPPNN